VIYAGDTTSILSRRDKKCIKLSRVTNRHDCASDGN